MPEPKHVLETAAFALTLFLTACGSSTETTPSNAAQSMPADVGLAPQFRSDTVEANGLTLRYVRGGDGPAVILVHGFPQDWSAWRQVMPLLAKQFTVVAVDLRGVGGSGGSESGFDGHTLASDLQQLADRLKLDRPFVVGHDIGGMSAYAYARALPQHTRGVMILDFPLPGIAPWAEVERDPVLWHFEFHQTPRLPEALLTGRQAIYFRDFLDRIGGSSQIFSDADVARFARAYESPSSLRAGLEFYRAFPDTARWNESQTNGVDVPIVLAGGERAVGPILETSAADVRSKGARNVTVEIVSEGGHWLPHEKPDQVAALIARHAAR